MPAASFPRSFQQRCLENPSLTGARRPLGSGDAALSRVARELWPSLRLPVVVEAGRQLGFLGLVVDMKEVGVQTSAWNWGKVPLGAMPWD